MAHLIGGIYLENNFKIEELQILEIIKKVVCIMPELIEKDKIYKKLLNEHTNLCYKIDICNSDMKNFYSTEYFVYGGFRNTHADIYSDQLPNDLEKMLFQKETTQYNLENLSRELALAEQIYEKLYNSQIEVLNSHGEDILKAIIYYLDIDIDLKKSDIDYSDLILENIKSDFEVLNNYQIELPFPDIYCGTITILKAILKKSFAYKKLKEKYNERNIDLEILNKKHKEYETLETEKFDYLIDKEYTLFNRLFRRKKLDKLDAEIDELSHIASELRGQIISLENVIEKLNLEKNNLYKVYVNCQQIINVLIDKLGEKSLKELIQRLKIKFIYTDDNYFDEKAEMKRLLKNWFEEDIKKINSEIEMEKLGTLKTDTQQKVLKK